MKLAATRLKQEQPERSMRHEAGCHQVETGNQLSCAHLKVRQPVYPERSMRHEAGCHQVETGNQLSCTHLKVRNLCIQKGQ